MAARSSAIARGAGRQSRAPGRRAPGRRAPAPARLRWDRIGRLAMLGVMVALVYLYASAGLRMLSTLSQSHHDRASVARLEREHRRLVREHESLTQPWTLEIEARKLGLINPGEQPYVISGLPRN